MTDKTDLLPDEIYISAKGFSSGTWFDKEIKPNHTRKFIAADPVTRTTRAPSTAAGTEQQKTVDAGELERALNYYGEDNNGEMRLFDSTYEDFMPQFKTLIKAARTHLTSKPNQDDLRKVREALEHAACFKTNDIVRAELKQALTIIDRIIGGGE